MALRVTTQFPGGNACAIEVGEVDGVEVVRFAASPHGGTEALWFDLAVTECSRSPVDLVLTNPDSCLAGAAQWDRVWPAVRHGDGHWQRLPAGRVAVLDDGRREVHWRVDAQAGAFRLAFCYPYGLEELEALAADTGGYWHRDAIGVSSAGRRLPRWRNGGGSEGSTVPGIYLIARQHAGETPGSWVLDGQMRRAAAVAPSTEVLLWTAPLANLDGVVEGDYGKDPFPHDLNRAWTVPPMRHEVLVLQRDMERWARRCRPVAVVDLHAPSGTETEGAYFFIPRATRCADEVEAARALLAQLLPHLPPDIISEEPVHQPSYPSRWDADGTLGSWAWNQLSTTELSMETPYGASRDLSLTPAEYARLGAALCDGLCELATAVDTT